MRKGDLATMHRPLRAIIGLFKSVSVRILSPGPQSMLRTSDVCARCLCSLSVLAVCARCLCSLSVLAVCAQCLCSMSVLAVCARCLCSPAAPELHAARDGRCAAGCLSRRQALDRRPGPRANVDRSKCSGAVNCTGQHRRAWST